jgi:hypothetical protein
MREHMHETEARHRKLLRTRPYEGLTKEEDNTLRQLAFFELAGVLSDLSRHRMRELRKRDRRREIRNPRPDPSAG